MTKKLILILLLTTLLFSAMGCSNLEDSVETIADDGDVIGDETKRDSVSHEQAREDDETIDDETVEFLAELTEEDAEEIDRLIGLFIEYASTSDFLSQMNLFTVDDYVNGYDIKFIAERMGVDTTYEGLENPTNESRLHDVNSMITRFLLGLIADRDGVKEKFDSGTLTNQDVNEAITNTDYSTLSIKRMDSPAEEIKGNEKFMNTKVIYSKKYGIENLDYRITLLELDGETFFCGFTLYKYNGEWSVFELDGGPVSFGAYIVVMPVSEEEYEELLNR